MQISGWTDTFETAESRRYKVLTWVAMPVGFHSSGYHSMLDEFGDDAAGVYGAWCALCSLAATCPARGQLAASNGAAYSVSRIARETHLAQHWFEKLIPWAVRQGWLIAGCDDEDTVEDQKPSKNNDKQQPPSSHPATTQQPPSSPLGFVELPNLTLPNLTLPNQESSSELAPLDSEPPPVVVLEFPCSGKRGGDVYSLTEDKLGQYQESYPGLDVLAECRKARQWCIDNSKRRKTKTGTPAFISSWLARAQNQGGGTSRSPINNKLSLRASDEGAIVW